MSNFRLYIRVFDNSFVVGSKNNLYGHLALLETVPRETAYQQDNCADTSSNIRRKCAPNIARFAGMRIGTRKYEVHRVDSNLSEHQRFSADDGERLAMTVAKKNRSAPSDDFDTSLHGIGSMCTDCF